MKLRCTVTSGRIGTGKGKGSRRKVATCPKSKLIGNKGYRKRKCYHERSMAKRVANSIRKEYGSAKAVRVVRCRTRPTKTAPRGRTNYCLYGRGRR